MKREVSYSDLVYLSDALTLLKTTKETEQPI
jgi:hypothetical protein